VHGGKGGSCKHGAEPEPRGSQRRVADGGDTAVIAIIAGDAALFLRWRGTSRLIIGEISYHRGKDRTAHIPGKTDLGVAATNFQHHRSPRVMSSRRADVLGTLGTRADLVQLLLRRHGGVAVRLGSGQLLTPAQRSTGSQPARRTAPHHTAQQPRQRLPATHAGLAGD
jgi:hypothetical protein